MVQHHVNFFSAYKYSPSFSFNKKTSVYCVLNGQHSVNNFLLKPQNLL